MNKPLMNQESVNKNKPYALITGASSGIGAALAEVAAREKYNLILIARRKERLVEVSDRCRKLNSDIDIRILTLDVSSPDFIERLKEGLVQIEDLRLVFANAGVGAAGRFDKLSIQDFERHFSVNVNGVLKTVYGTMEGLKKAHGRLVIIGSLNSYMALPLGAPYCMGKFAVRALAESLYCESPTLGIEVSLVCPGPIATEIFSVNNKGEKVESGMQPMANALSAQTAAERIFRGVRCGKREIFLSADSKILIGFERHFPSLALWITRVVFSRYHERFLKLVGQVNPDSV